jgi:hypothetical protein
MMSIKEEFPNITELERACKLLDELLCLMGMNGRTLDLHCQREAMDMIAAARKNNPNYPITVWLADMLKERGLLSGKKTIIG